MMQVNKRMIRRILGFVVGMAISLSVAYASTTGILYASDEVSYDNSEKNLQSENVQDVLDELYNACGVKGSNTFEEIIETFSYTGDVQTYNVPASGSYKLEVWGAQGGSYDSSYAGGKGGYSTGIVNLAQGDTLYVYVGGKGTGSGTSTTGSVTGGFNGGGQGYSSSTTYLSSAGGGASDIRINEDSLYKRVIVAGGGGGAGSYDGSYRQSGGAGGGESGIKGSQYNTSYLAGLGGSSTSAGTSYYGTTANSTSYGTPAKFGQGGSAGSSSGVSGGGGGWYGGGYGRRSSGGGGSGYVYTSATASQCPQNCLDSSYYLTDASTIAGNASMPTQDGTSTMTGNSEKGYAKITRVS